MLGWVIWCGGLGKEMGREVNCGSGRAGGFYVEVNCGSGRAKLGCVVEDCELGVQDLLVAPFRFLRHYGVNRRVTS